MGLVLNRVEMKQKGGYYYKRYYYGYYGKGYGRENGRNRSVADTKN